MPRPLTPTCAPDADWHENCCDGDPESSREGVSDESAY
jgi:hypothetical protein